MGAAIAVGIGVSVGVGVLVAAGVADGVAETVGVASIAMVAVDVFTGPALGVEVDGGEGGVLVVGRPDGVAVVSGGGSVVGVLASGVRLATSAVGRVGVVLKREALGIAEGSLVGTGERVGSSGATVGMCLTSTRLGAGAVVLSASSSLATASMMAGSRGASLVPRGSAE